MLKQLITGREKGKCIGSFFNRASALNDSALHFYEVVEEDSCVEQEGSEHQAEGDRCPLVALALVEVVEGELVIAHIAGVRSRKSRRQESSTSSVKFLHSFCSQHDPMYSPAVSQRHTSLAAQLRKLLIVRHHRSSGVETGS